MESATVYITKYALTKGILEVSTKDPWSIGIVYEKHHFADRKKAVLKANEMRSEKIIKLRMQIQELEEMDFAEERRQLDFEDTKQ